HQRDQRRRILRIDRSELRIGRAATVDVGDRRGRAYVGERERRRRRDAAHCRIHRVGARRGIRGRGQRRDARRIGGGGAGPQTGGRASPGRDRGERGGRGRYRSAIRVDDQDGEGARECRAGRRELVVPRIDEDGGRRADGGWRRERRGDVHVPGDGERAA